MSNTILNEQRGILDINFYDNDNNIVFNNITFNNNINITDSTYFLSTLTTNNITSNDILTVGGSTNNLSAYSISSIKYSGDNVTTVDILTSIVNTDNLIVTNNITSDNSHTITLVSAIINIQLISSTNILLNSDNINIGTTNNIINIYGSTNAINIDNLRIEDTIINLNRNPIDNGNNSGILIDSNAQNGIIASNNESDFFNIKAPDNTTQVMLLSNNNNELFITGYSTIQNNYITRDFNGKEISINEITVLNTLTTDDLNTNKITINNIIHSNNIYITSQSNITNNITTNDLYCNLITTTSDIEINSSIICEYNITSNNIQDNNNVSNSIDVLNSKNNKLNINGNFDVSNTSNIVNNISNDITINNILNTNNFNPNNISIHSDLNIENYYSTQNVTSHNSIIMGKVIIPDVAEYETNLQAFNASIPLNKIFRSGGILKIRVNETLPNMTLIGNSTINLTLGNQYIDPGVNSNDYLNNKLDVFIISIGNDTYNIQLINNTEVTQVSSISTQGLYTITYKSTDSDGLSNTITRDINIT